MKFAQLGYELFVHDQCIDESEPLMMEGAGKGARHREAELLPETDCPLVGGDDQVELHSAKIQRNRLPLRMFAHGSCDPLPLCLRGHHIAAIANVCAEARLAGFDEIGSRYAPIGVTRHIGGRWKLDPGAVYVGFCAPR
jgi:hypothetical protein